MKILLTCILVFFSTMGISKDFLFDVSQCSWLAHKFGLRTIDLPNPMAVASIRDISIKVPTSKSIRDNAAAESKAISDVETMSGLGDANLWFKGQPVAQRLIDLKNLTLARIVNKNGAVRPEVALVVNAYAYNPAPSRVRSYLYIKFKVRKSDGSIENWDSNSDTFYHWRDSNFKLMEQAYGRLNDGGIQIQKLIAYRGNNLSELALSFTAHLSNDISRVNT